MQHKILIVFACLLAFMACSKKSETLLTDGYDEAEMDAAIEKARSECDQFIEILVSMDADSFSVKAPISDGTSTEHFWLTDIRYRDGSFTGKIGNDPGIVKHVAFGQVWTIPKEEISDWMYTRGDRIHGGYTIDPLLATMAPEQADELRNRLVR